MPEVCEARTAMTPEREPALMSRRRKVVVTSGVFGLIGAVVATLGVVDGISAARRNGIVPAPGEPGVLLLCSTLADSRVAG